MFRLLVSLCALPALAQTPWLLPEPPGRALAPDARTLGIFRKPLTVAQPRVQLPIARMPNERKLIDLKMGEPAAKPCAVPLKNMLRFRDTDPPIRKFTPRGPFNMREFPVPAPSCEDKERK